MLAARGDQIAFQTLYKVFKPKVASLAKRRGLPLKCVEDYLQDLWVHVWKKLKNVKQEGSFAGWLYRIAINRLNDQYIKMQNRPDEILLPPELYEKLIQSLVSTNSDNLPEEYLSRSEIRDAVRRAIDTLDERSKKVIELRFFFDSSYANIAIEIGDTPGNARQIAFRAKKQLADKLCAFQESPTQEV